MFLRPIPRQVFPGSDSGAITVITVLTWTSSSATDMDIEPDADTMELQSKKRKLTY
jgi:hypothetical protein